MDSTDTLFASIGDPATDEDSAWEAIRELQSIATRDVLERSVHLTTHDHPRVRAHAASVLGQLGIPDRVFPDECFQTLLDRLEIEHDEEVIDAVICAMGHLHDARAIAPVLKFAEHKNEEIRFAVAFALCGRREPQAVAALIALTRDSDAEVRDWATFGIGANSEADTPEIRDALINRLKDSDGNTRQEALCGLVRLRDKRVVLPLIDHLKAHPSDSLLLSAAGEFLGWDDKRTTNSSLDEILAGLAERR